jgi:predicted transcriptional regulator
MPEQTFGLPGLRVIRDSCGISAVRLSTRAGCSYTFFKRVENLKQDCSLQVLRDLCGILCCSGDDLLGTPSRTRVEEIQAAYHEQEAIRARGVAVA